MPENKKFNLFNSPFLLGLLGVLFILCLLLVAGASYALSSDPIPDVSRKPVNLVMARRLAGETDLPVRLNIYDFASGSYPGAIIATGSDFSPITMDMTVFQIVNADGSKIMIDAGLTQADFNAMFPGGTFDAARFERTQAALRGASLILFTHEHRDHLAGLLNSPYQAELLPKARLTQAQLDNAGRYLSVSEAQRSKIQTLNYTDYLAVAPGVVLIAMPGHTPGSQMVYVRLADGKEYLLAGDVVWNMLNLTRPAGRARLISLGLGEDSTGHVSQVRALVDVMKSDPNLHILLTHDLTQLNLAVKEGWVQRTLE
ncbi:MAG TPA: MBL fold metallo-hydrolase [Anaerolineaceae bacterium]|nr:MBL fold metallo-hydrolase [Anaerolineaceae bacterium]HPN51184.1 MBL fold metallo-hydrolase [Anaerolineaceae bacterium]